MRVCLDPGHGGNDTGAVGPTGLSEAQVALAVCLSLREHLTALGHQALLTRESDEALAEDAEQDRHLRRQKAKFSLCQAFISVHCAASDNPNASGISTLYSRGDAYSALLATHIQQSVVSASGGLPNLGILPVSDLRDIRSLHMPAVVVQLGYISNPGEEALLADAAWIDRMAEAMVRAIAVWHDERAAAVQAEDEDPMRRKSRQEEGTEKAQAEEEVAEEDSSAPPESAVQADSEEAKHEETSLQPEPAISRASPHAVRITPVIQAALNVPGHVSTAGVAHARATHSISSAQQIGAASQSSVIGLPGSATMRSGSAAQGRSAAAQGIRVTTTVRKPRG